MENNKIYIAVIAVVAILAAGIGWGVGTQSAQNSEKPAITAGVAAAGLSDGIFSEEKPRDVITLRMAVSPTSFHLGRIVVADKYGFFREEGLKIEYVNIPVGAGPALAALKKGEIDIFSGGTGHPDGFINAFKGGVRVKAVVASTFGHPNYPHDTAWVPIDSPIKEPKDVIGKKVGGLVTGGWDQGCMAFYWNQYFKMYNLSRDQVINAVVPPQQQEQAIQQGLIDIMTVHPPQTGVIERSGKYRRLWSSWDITNGDVIDKQEAEISVSGFTEEFFQKNPEAVRRYVRAMAKAQAFDNDNHELYSDWIQGQIGWSPKVREGGDHHNWATGLIRESAVQKWIDWYVDMGLLKPGEIKPSDLYTNEFNPYSKYTVNDPVRDPTYWDTLPKEYLYLPVKGATSK